VVIVAIVAVVEVVVEEVVPGIVTVVVVVVVVAGVVAVAVAAAAVAAVLTVVGTLKDDPSDDVEPVRWVASFFRLGRSRDWALEWLHAIRALRPWASAGEVVPVAAVDTGESSLDADSRHLLADDVRLPNDGGVKNGP